MLFSLRIVIYTYRIVEKFGEDFNLMVWQIAKHLPNLVIMHDIHVFRNTHMHKSKNRIRM